MSVATKIKQLIQEHGEMRVATLRKHFPECNENTVRTALWRLTQEGVLKRVGYGQYSLNDGKRGYDTYYHEVLAQLEKGTPVYLDDLVKLTRSTRSKVASRITYMRSLGVPIYSLGHNEECRYLLFEDIT
ncbi:winged helix-turn-helix DNA-binding domain protein [Vibrio phage 1.261.O._10N.286.51.A7]|uniref:Winged helix-turn-helix DNA-binding domain protein n=2 Tax=Mukerjeevirus TaxID=2733146 RepID=A0A2I7RRW4_9CAUD|nr:winged helix-turn-helix DNA-binding domain protein [Vibrio phage 1.224.A._10N.261.48.B1]YP_009817708.1 winged helix-turn-helix DNA-binding domain protein [Vibrio phage 1.261.O._10N.286.51.A7]AUR96391.1 winged helix-turn-helix DNA-binding domain protein [Vibrio phage 1.224.A._10N.261.48.B1]AUR99027.1 winged helix-turn-helix DNA-binding domain protein [Vibrio phage 1.261.O._10N.286.51.A7]